MALLGSQACVDAARTLAEQAADVSVSSAVSVGSVQKHALAPLSAMSVTFGNQTHGKLLALSSRPEARTAEARGDVAKLRKAMARNLAWAPLTLHWSSEKGLLSEVMVGLLACVPSTIQMRDLWQQTAVVKK